MLGAMAVLSSMDAGVKWLLLRDIPVVQVIALRGWIVTSTMLLMIAVKYDLMILRTGKLRQHLLRAAMGFFAPLSFFLSLKYLPLADATAIFFCGIFFMTAGSAWMFAEPVGKHRWLAVFIGFMGVLLIVRPGAGVFHPASLLLIVGAASYALMMLWGRKLTETESTFNIMFYFNLVFTLIGSLAVPFVWHDMGLPEILVLLLVSALALSGYYLMTRAFTLASLSLIAPLEYTSLVWALLLGYLLWGDLPDGLAWFGIAVIVASGLYILYREKRQPARS
ncbi:MAG: DMT family transporter [Gammaproteobacteria bacterium]|nr:DMT family transporter [Gammaproteobacteria bacterium]